MGGLICRGGVEDARLEAKAKDTKKFEAKDRPSRGQGQGPRTQTQVFSKKKDLQNFFSGKKVLQKIFFQAISTCGNQKKEKIAIFVIFKITPLDFCDLIVYLGFLAAIFDTEIAQSMWFCPQDCLPVIIELFFAPSLDSRCGNLRALNIVYVVICCS